MNKTFVPGIVSRISLLVAMALPVPVALHAQTASYLGFKELTAELRSLVEGSEMARMRSVAMTAGGREVWVVELGNPSGKPIEERPGLLVVGNLEGDHLVGSSLALGTIRHFLQNAASDPDIKAILDEGVIYLFPRLNADGAEGMFAPTKWDRRRNARPYDDDNDGRVDEDGPEDLNGDGLITVMRLKDPSGDYMIDSADSRLMKKADPKKGERGEYTIHWEGIDSDGDGFINEDGPGGVDLNRNFQHEHPYYERDAGPHMVSEPETRALMDFIIANRNIAAILTFGQSDNLVTPPDSRGGLASPRVLALHGFADASNEGVFDVGRFSSGPAFFFGGFPRLRGAQPGRDNDPNSGRRPATTVNGDDLEYFEAISDAYREITGIESVGINRKAEGAFFQVGYYQYGVPSFSTPGWGLPKGEGKPSGEDGGPDGKILEALEGAGIDAFVPWTPFQHSELGEVEIGGFRPYTTTNPPSAELPELGRKHAEFVVKLASMLPRVEIVSAEVTAHGGGIFTVTAEVENSGYLPTSLAHGRVSRSVQATTVRIHIPAEDILTGARKTHTIATLDGSRTRERVSWVIQGKPGSEIEIRVRAQKGGTDTKTVTLR